MKFVTNFMPVEATSLPGRLCDSGNTTNILVFDPDIFCADKSYKNTQVLLR